LAKNASITYKANPGVGNQKMEIATTKSQKEKLSITAEKSKQRKNNNSRVFYQNTDNRSRIGVTRNFSMTTNAHLTKLTPWKIHN